MRSFLVILSLLAVAGCENASIGTKTCPAADLQHLIGAPQGALDPVGYDPTRIAGPDDVVTMDYNPERLDVRVDAGGRIVSITCG